MSFLKNLLDISKKIHSVETHDKPVYSCMLVEKGIVSFEHGAVEEKIHTLFAGSIIEMKYTTHGKWKSPKELGKTIDYNFGK